MKKALSCAVLFCACTLALAMTSEAQIEIGDSKEKVLSVLGSPTGSMVVGGNEILVFEQGTIELQNGKVITFDLMSDRALAVRKEQEEAKKKKLAEQKERDRNVKAQAARAKQLPNTNPGKKPLPSDPHAVAAIKAQRPELLGLNSRLYKAARIDLASAIKLERAALAKEYSELSEKLAESQKKKDEYVPVHADLTSAQARSDPAYQKMASHLVGQINARVLADVERAQKALDDHNERKTAFETVAAKREGILPKLFESYKRIISDSGYGVNARDMTKVYEMASELKHGAGGAGVVMRIYLFGPAATDAITSDDMLGTQETRYPRKRTKQSDDAN